MRARTVRGYKSWLGMQTGLMLAGRKLDKPEFLLEDTFLPPISPTRQPCMLQRLFARILAYILKMMYYTQMKVLFQIHTF